MRTRVYANTIQLNKKTFRSSRRQIIALFSFFVVLGVFWCLKLTGITMAGEAFCGMEEHQHGADCPTNSLICDLNETSGHVHDESCILRTLVCELEEELPQTSDRNHLRWELICTESEQEGHMHDETCCERILVCTEEEQEGHVHTDGCFESELICDSEEEEHTHDSACYEDFLTCDMEEAEGHYHIDTCYVLGEEYICGLEETAGHAHTKACYASNEDEQQDAVEVETEGHIHTDECYAIGIGFGCGLTEKEGHVHTEECLMDETELDCGEVYTPAHIHTEECYEAVSECPLEEHIHVASCYSNIEVDLETEDDWEDSLRDVKEELSTAQMLVSIARSQLGYTESTLNFEVDLHGDRRGITRYGQWYGNPYGNWQAMFVSFCLHYAGAVDLPSNAGPESMRLEWEEEGLYVSADTAEPQAGNVIFLRADETSEEYAAANEELLYTDENAAFMVAIISEVNEDTITIIQGDWEDAVAERSIDINDPAILGYGLVPESSPFALRAIPTGDLSYLASSIYYSGNASNTFTKDRSFVLYVEHDGQYYALGSQTARGIEVTVDAIPVFIDEDGGIYTDIENPDSLLWNFTSNGNNYSIRNVATQKYLHPGGDPGVIYDREWPTAVRNNNTGGAQLVHTNNNNNYGIYFNSDRLQFEIRSKNEASTIYFGVAEGCTVWLDGTNGGLSSFGGSQNQSYSVTVGSQMTLPMEWLSPTKYSYRLRGWYDVTHNAYYAPGEKVTITENTVFYADWMAATYDIGQYNAYVADTVSTNGFITTHLFDYNYLFNVLSAEADGTTAASEHSEDWSIVQNENVEYENRESLNFIFLDYGAGGTLDYPSNRVDGRNQFPGQGIVTGGIYNSAIGDALFNTNDRLPGKVYLGTADHLFQLMDDESNPYYGYYYYDSARNAASYNQSAGRFYVYDYLEATSAELSAAKSDFLPLNSPYANTNAQQVGTYTADDEHAEMTNYVYDAKFSDSDNKVSTNYAFGMKMDIQFYLPNKPGEDGNKDLYGNDMRFFFSGDDDLWVLVDGKLALDIGGIHMAETGEINFSTGEVTVQGVRNNALSNIVSALEPGEHTLTVMYLERGASHSNCAIYFNLAPRYQLEIQKEDVLTRDVLNGAQFSVFRDLECTIPAELWESQESYLQGASATNTFTVKNGSVNMWGMGASNTYYIKETRPPDDSNYGFPRGIIRMILDKKGAATYNVLILDGGEGISGGFTVHGFRVDEETQQAYIIATNAPKWVEEVTSVEARKFWADGLDHSGEDVTVYLTIHDPDGTVRRLQEAQLNEENDWQHLWENLPKYYEDGTEIQYGVEEAYVSGYYSQVTKVDSYSSTTNQWAATTTLENGRTYLLKTSKGYLSTQNQNSDTGYMWVNEATAKESALAQWTVATGNGGYKLTNKAGQTITFYYGNGRPTDFYASTGGESNNAKQYLSYRVQNGSIRFYYDAPNNQDYYLVTTMTSANKFQCSTQSGNAMSFTPMTLTPVASGSELAKGEWAYQITNTPLNTETSLTVYKQWRIDVGDDPTLYEQAQVTVKLLANGKETGRTVTLSLKNGWTDVFRGLPYQDNNGNVIQYTVEESWVNEDWMAEYGAINSSGGSVPTYDTTVTNVYRWGHGEELPATGNIGPYGYVIVGFLIMAGSLIWYYGQRRKYERRGR